jgi:AmmeMemoRadiSam system protein B/AmmeMemoRadiSam system protein A
VLVLAVFLLGVISSEAVGKKVQPNSLAGRWYSGSEATLKKDIEGFLTKAQVEPREDVVAVILPHAGYRYSGQTATYGLKAIKKQYKRIVVIGPSHYISLIGKLSVPDVTHYSTPLGEVALDVEFIEKLKKHKMFETNPSAHKYEHSVQIELPLLQYYQKDFKFVPIVVGVCSIGQIREAAAVLRDLVDEETLVVASSDFVHHGPNYGYTPFEKNKPEQIKKLLEFKMRTGATICGCVPVAILLSMLEGPVKAELVKYATSGELLGDYKNSVSYLSIVFSKGEEGIDASKGKETKKSKKKIEPLSEEDKKELLKLSRKTMDYFMERRRVPKVSELGVEIGDSLRREGAVFITLKKEDELRGCIGDILPSGSLYESVIRNTINASVNDWRFQQVTKSECNDITIEISALTVPQRIESPKDIRLGTDGIILRKGDMSAVYLPYVPLEQGWNLEETLSYLALKAGLKPKAWKEGAEFLVFQATVFSEEK